MLHFSVRRPRICQMPTFFIQKLTPFQLAYKPRCISDQSTFTTVAPRTKPKPSTTFVTPQIILYIPDTQQQQPQIQLYTPKVFRQPMARPLQPADALCHEHHKSSDACTVTKEGAFGSPPLVSCLLHADSPHSISIASSLFL